MRSVRHYLLPDAHLQTVPLCIINGETTLDKQQTQRQLKLGHSAYAASVGEMHTFVGLSETVCSKETSELQGGKYYFYLIIHDAAAGEATHEKPYWTATATKEEMHAYTTEKTRHLHPRFREIMDMTPVEGMKAPPVVIRDMIVEDLPEGRVTVIGDAAHPMTPCKLPSSGLVADFNFDADIER